MVPFTGATFAARCSQSQISLLRPETSTPQRAGRRPTFTVSAGTRSSIRRCCVTRCCWRKSADDADRSNGLGTDGVVLGPSLLRHWNRDRGKNHVELA